VLKATPADLGNGFITSPDQRVICAQDGMLFAAAVVRDRGFEKAPTSVFEWARSQTLARKDRKGEARDGVVDGKRVFMNRDARDGIVAEVGFVEVDKTAIILFMSSGDSNQQDQVGGILDKFAQSMRVAAK